MFPRPVKEPKDIHGRRVRLGAKVRVLKIAPWVLARLEASEKRLVRWMVGQVFAVDEIDRSGHPWVVKWFTRHACHSIALDAPEMELVLPNRKGRRARQCTIAKPRWAHTRWGTSDSPEDT